MEHFSNIRRQKALASLIHYCLIGGAGTAELKKAFEELRHGGACTINRPCAQQYVGKYQSCMVISGRFIVHAAAVELLKQDGGLSRLWDKHDRYYLRYMYFISA